MEENNKIRVAITHGDTNGIGYELIFKTFAEPEMLEICTPIIYGSPKAAAYHRNVLDIQANFSIINSAEEARDGRINLLPTYDEETKIDMGIATPESGTAALKALDRAMGDYRKGLFDVLVTAPINKEALRAAEINFIGHTEIFAELTGTNDPLTMFETNGMRVFFLTRHVSLRDMLDMITKDRVIDYVERCTEALRRLGVTEGTMAVAGLNPHSGEHGLFGWEEVNEIAPAVEELQARGFDVKGPVPADSVFHQAALGRYNSVLSLYHDQGHIATKTLDFDRTIAITNSMPILRTSVDHGTAFDIAGKGIAGAVSMIESVRLAARYAPYFTR